MGQPVTLGGGSMMLGSSFGMGDSLAKTGIQKRYQSITNIKESTFKRD